MGTIDLRGDGVNTEMETGSRSTAAPIVAHLLATTHMMERTTVHRKRRIGTDPGDSQD